MKCRSWAYSLYMTNLLCGSLNGQNAVGWQWNRERTEMRRVDDYGTKDKHVYEIKTDL